MRSEEWVVGRKPARAFRRIAIAAQQRCPAVARAADRLRHPPYQFKPNALVTHHLTEA
jgi:hypothetical protein